MSITPQDLRNTSSTSGSLVAAFRGTNGCFHPVRLRGESVDLATGEVVRSSLTVACRNRRAVICASCADLYQADAWILVAAGLGGGKGVAAEIATHPRFFVTLTAPTFGPVHRSTAHGHCREFSNEQCVHEGLLVCREQHRDDDDIVGTPLCVECFDYRAAVLWNHAVSQLWIRTMQEARRASAQLAGVSRQDVEATLTLSFLKVVEFQRRGLAHIHAIVRADGRSRSEPPDWLTSDLLSAALERAQRRAWVNNADGARVLWGVQHEIAPIEIGATGVSKVAAYVAKYATKTTTGDLSFAYRFTSRSQIEATQSSEHLKRLAVTCFDLSKESEFLGQNFDRCAHAFGLKGQLVTKSRGYSTTFQALRQARAEHQRVNNTHLVLPGSFSYQGRGYDDPRFEAGAQRLHQFKIDARRERREAKLASLNESTYVVPS
jgi:hypothetical protein